MLELFVSGWQLLRDPSYLSIHELTQKKGGTMPFRLLHQRADEVKRQILCADSGAAQWHSCVLAGCTASGRSVTVVLPTERPSQAGATLGREFIPTNQPLTYSVFRKEEEDET